MPLQPGGDREDRVQGAAIFTGKGSLALLVPESQGGNAVHPLRDSRDLGPGLLSLAQLSSTDAIPHPVIEVPLGGRRKAARPAGEGRA